MKVGTNSFLHNIFQFYLNCEIFNNIHLLFKLAAGNRLLFNKYIQFFIVSQLIIQIFQLLFHLLNI